MLMGCVCLLHVGVCTVSLQPAEKKIEEQVRVGERHKREQHGVLSYLPAPKWALDAAASSSPSSCSGRHVIRADSLMGEHTQLFS